jgi:long-chain acyl-CoA synthetase
LLPEEPFIDLSNTDKPAMQLAPKIRENLSKNPDKPALEFEGVWHTWGDINRYVDKINSVLNDQRIPAEAPVGLVARNRPPQAAAILGAIAYDRAISMIYAFQTPETIAKDVTNLRLAALIAEERDWTPEVIAAAKATGTLGIMVSLQGGLSVSLVPGLESLGAGPHRPPFETPGMELLSSGTTGAPKRIQIPMAALIRGVISATLGAEPTDDSPPAILFWPLGNIAVVGLIGNAYIGSRMVLLEKFTVNGLVNALKTYKAPALAAAPPVIRLILEAKVPKEDLASIQYAYGGSAALEPETQELFEKTYGIPVYWGYGATEFAGTVCTWTPDLRKQYGDSKRGSIGKALAGAELRVVDPETGAELPRNQQGHLEGRVEVLGPKWIRTTDLASMDEDGFVFLHGRGDGAINRGGFKIIPERVIDVLRRHELVRDASVVGLPDSILGHVPVAAIEKVAGAPAPSAAELEAHVRAHLPAHHVPTRFIVVEALPRTPSLKVVIQDVKRLFE